MTKENALHNIRSIVSKELGAWTLWDYAITAALIALGLCCGVAFVAIVLDWSV